MGRVKSVIIDVITCNYISTIKNMYIICTLYQMVNIVVKLNTLKIKGDQKATRPPNF